MQGRIPQNAKTMKKLLIVVIAIPLFYSCSPPRSIISSGKVATKNQVQLGVTYGVNVSTSPISQTIKGVKDYANFEEMDSIKWDAGLEHINAAAIAYCLDPIGYKTDFYGRYGLGHNMDIGYRYSGKAHAFDARYQFLGSNRSYQYSDYKGMYGSVGLQYSWQHFEFIDRKWDQLQRVFDLKMARKDVSIPLVFSKSFGPEEKYGALSFGAVYTHSFVRYKVDPKNIYFQNNEGAQELLAPLNAKNHYSSYGMFINVKGGYKFIFFTAGLTTYYQKYGSYALLGGGDVKLEGWTFIPTYGMQFNILPRKKHTDLRTM